MGEGGPLCTKASLHGIFCTATDRSTEYTVLAALPCRQKRPISGQTSVIRSPPLPISANMLYVHISGEKELRINVHVVHEAAEEKAHGAGGPHTTAKTSKTTDTRRGVCQLEAFLTTLRFALASRTPSYSKNSRVLRNEKYEKPGSRPLPIICMHCLYLATPPQCLRH